jgi:hypothetical protein
VILRRRDDYQRVLAELGGQLFATGGEVDKWFQCGKPAKAMIPRWGMYFACVLPQNHEGPCAHGGTCFKHGPYVGDKCPQWPNCEPEIKQAVSVGAQRLSLQPDNLTSSSCQWEPSDASKATPHIVSSKKGDPLLPRAIYDYGWESKADAEAHRANPIPGDGRQTTESIAIRLADRIAQHIRSGPEREQAALRLANSR